MHRQVNLRMWTRSNNSTEDLLSSTVCISHRKRIREHTRITRGSNICFHFHASLFAYLKALAYTSQQRIQFDQVNLFRLTVCIRRARLFDTSLLIEQMSHLLRFLIFSPCDYSRVPQSVLENLYGDTVTRALLSAMRHKTSSAKFPGKLTSLFSSRTKERNIYNEKLKVYPGWINCFLSFLDSPLIDSDRDK